MSSSSERDTGCMFSAFICSHLTCDFSDFVCLFIGSTELLCLKTSACCAVGAEPRGCGMVTEDDEICKIGCYICNCGLIVPRTCCTGASQMCCLKDVMALPFHEDYLNEFVCAVYGIACAPECGCCVNPPACKALKEMKDGVAAPTSSNMQRE